MNMNVVEAFVDCLRCGPVKVENPATLAKVQSFLDAFSRPGGYTHLAITCPRCGDEVTSAQVRRDAR